jgi:hypothetical protein
MSNLAPEISSPAGKPTTKSCRRNADLRRNPQTSWWKDQATRPYLRAIYGRAMTDWHLGRFIESVTALEDLLSCNPTDNQGVRFFIPMLHLLAEAPDKAAKFFARYEAEYQNDFKEPSFIFGWALSCSTRKPRERGSGEIHRRHTEEHLHRADAARNTGAA